MPKQETKYLISRAAFVDWAFKDKIDFTALANLLKHDLTISGECIITAENLLSGTFEVPKRLAKGYEKTKGNIPSNECDFYYKQPVDD